MYWYHTRAFLDPPLTLSRLVSASRETLGRRIEKEVCQRECLDSLPHFLGTRQCHMYGNLSQFESRCFHSRMFTIVTSSGGLVGWIFIFLESVRIVLTSWRVSTQTENFEFWVHFSIWGGWGATTMTEGDNFHVFGKCKGCTYFVASFK